MRETIGEVRCPFHTAERMAEVRKDKNGKLYFFCPGCGPVHPHGVSFKNWIINNASIYGANEVARV
jgi:hypothetical protein